MYFQLPETAVYIFLFPTLQEGLETPGKKHPIAQQRIFNMDLNAM